MAEVWEDGVGTTLYLHYQQLSGPHGLGGTWKQVVKQMQPKHFVRSLQSAHVPAAQRTLAAIQQLPQYLHIPAHHLGIERQRRSSE